MPAINFHEQVRTNWFIGRRKMKVFIEELFSCEKIPLHHLDVVLCSDDYLLQINQQFLKHNTLTDIITFDLSGSDASGKTGEIYISVDRIMDNAGKFAVPRTEELHRVIFHGCLHLCGYKDKLNGDKQLMRKKEDQYLRLYKKRST